MCLVQNFSSCPIEMFTSLWRHRRLIYALTKREVLGRYRGSALGFLWSFFNPLLMLAVYTFVFSVVFQARWDIGSASKTDFALLLFVGLIFYNLFAESAIRAPSLILSNVNYVKKVVFPLQILPVVNLLSVLVHAIVSLLVWLFAFVIFVGVPQPTVFLLPLLLLPFLMFLVGLGWMLSSLGVFLRDVSQIIGLIATALMFISPIFYPISAFPKNFQYILHINPLTIVIEQARQILFWGEIPDFLMLGIYWAATLIIAWIGFLFFQKTRKGFSDVL